MTDRKFYKTVVEVTVLSEEPIHNLELSELQHEIFTGDCSGDVAYHPHTVINGKEAAQALHLQGSDPSFFRLTWDGDDLTEENEDEMSG